MFGIFWWLESHLLLNGARGNRVGKLSCRMNKVLLLSVSCGWWILIKNLPDCDWSWINRTFSIKVPVLFYLWLSWVKRPCVFSLYDPKQQNSPATETKGIFQISSAGLENYSVGLETFIYFIADCLIWYVNVILKKGNHTHLCFDRSFIEKNRSVVSKKYISLFFLPIDDDRLI